MARSRYFAYGSNLNTEDRWRWSARRGRPDLLGEELGVAYLPDTELVFDYESTSRSGGALNLRARHGQLTPGVLFDVDEEDREELDRKEGAPHSYRRRVVEVLTEDGRQIEAFTYEVVPRRASHFVPPTSDYVDVVRQGLEEYGLGDAMLGAAAENRCAPWTVDGLFVYGTLLRGECRRSQLEAASELLCTWLAGAPGRLVDLGDYPGLVHPALPFQRVKGEYVRVRDVGRVIELLDQIEDFRGYGADGSLYTRLLTRVEVDGSRRLAWTYYLSKLPMAARFIHSGCWRQSRNRRGTP